VDGAPAMAQLWDHSDADHKTMHNIEVNLKKRRSTNSYEIGFTFL